MEAHIALFTKFYTDRSSGRKLMWIHHLSYGLVQAHFLDKRYEFSLSFYQMLILLLVRSFRFDFCFISICLFTLALYQFNTTDSLARGAILERMNLTEHESHHLDSLVKVRLSRRGNCCLSNILI